MTATKCCNKTEIGKKRDTEVQTNDTEEEPGRHVAEKHEVGLRVFPINLFFSEFSVV